MSRWTIIAAVLATAVAGAAAPPQDDPFLWLEDIDGERALGWVRAQNERTAALLEQDPRFDTLYREALEILTSTARIPYGDIRGEHVFNFWQDADHVRGVLRRATLASFLSGEPRWETLLDVDELAVEEDENWVYQGYSCLAPKHERCLVRLSRGGTDASVHREFLVATRAFLSDGFVVPQAKSSVQWIDRDHLLVGTDWGDGRLTESGYATVVRRWRRGTPLAEATPVVSGEGSDVGVFAGVYRGAGRAGGVYPIVRRAVTFFESEYHWLTPGGEVRKLPLPLRSDVVGVLDGRLIATLREDWSHGGEDFGRGELVALSLDDLSAESVYRPGASEAVEDVEIGHTAIFVELLDDVAGKVRRLERRRRGTWQSREVPLPANGVVSIVSTGGGSDQLLVSHESLTTPDSLYYVSERNRVQRIESLPEYYDASDVVVEQRFATSRDGTRVPYFIMGRKDVLARGNAPTVQYGYGGFLAAILPHYYQDPARPQHGALAGRLWVARGGVLVLSNIRGGGEYGPAWHAAALRHQRPRAFEDFFAIAEHLIETGVTTPQRLGAIGRSNGGLLMGVALTRRPDLYAAIDCGVPLLDMLRYHRLLAGASWVGEYGDPDVPADREVLAAYSPYQNLRPADSAPAVLLYTSTRDDRVHPGHARKMAAKMDRLDLPFIYYENIEGGHGGTANQEQLAYRTALEYWFFLRELMDPAAAERRAAAAAD